MRMKGIAFWVGCIVVGLALMYTGGRMGAKHSLPVNLLGFRGEAVSSLFQQPGGESFIQVEKNKLAAFDRVDIEINNAQVSVEASDQFGLEIGYYDDQPIEWEATNGLLRVSNRARVTRVTSFIMLPFGSISKTQNGYVRVYCPADALDDVNINTVSGRVTVSGLSTESLNVETVSGRIGIQDCTADWMNVETVSGRVEVQDCVAAQVNTETVSGRIELAGVTGDDVALTTVSGRISYETDRAAAQYGIQLYTVSGALEVNDVRVGKKSYINVGNTAAPYLLMATSVSGRIELHFAS